MYIIVSIIVLLIIMALVFLVKGDGQHKKLTPLASVSFGFILVGILFGDNEIFSYSMFGIGIIFAFIRASTLKRINRKK